MSTRGDEPILWIVAHNITPVEIPFFQKETALRAVVGVTCCLSLIGALVIILSYCIDKEVRTKSRLILVHLSLADFGVAMANLIGVVVYFDQYISQCSFDYSPLSPASHVHANVVSSSHPINSPLSCDALHGLCKTQAFVAGYATLASVLWTQVLAVYIYCLVVLPDNKLYGRVLYFAYVFCWGMPLVICIWLICTDKLGYSPHGGAGWCTLKVHDDKHRLNTFAIIFANDLWMYLTFIIVSFLYFSTHCFIRTKLHPSLLSGNGTTVVNKADTKFLLIPCSFLLLRIWTQLLIILLVYAKLSLNVGVVRFLIYASGIGDSGQGLVNAFLFCILTPKVRHKLFTRSTYVLCCMKLYWICCMGRSSSDNDGYATIHSMASVDLQRSSSTSYPILQSHNKRYSSCTVAMSATSGSTVPEDDLPSSMCK